MPGEVIRCKAAVAWAAKQPLVIEEIEVDPPKEHEVRIKIVATGLCHTDATLLSGEDAEAIFPIILGHEGAGVVESIGPGVTSVAVGDHVIPCYIPQCYECKFCLSYKTNLCSKIRETQGKGLMPDGTSRFRCKGQTLYHFMGTSCFSQFTVVAEISVAKISPKAPLHKVGLLGCGVSTGLGAVLNTAKVDPGSTCAIWGLGAVGLAVVSGCKTVAARQIICIDKDPRKFAKARAAGGTDFIDASQAGLCAKDEVLRLTDNAGCDYSFECVGNVKLMRDALEACHKGWGVCTIIGVAKAGEEISTKPFQLVTGRTWQGTAFGGFKSRDTVPRLVEDSINGRIDLDFYITKTVSIAKVNEALNDLHHGDCIRIMLAHDLD